MNKRNDDKLIPNTNIKWSVAKDWSSHGQVYRAPGGTLKFQGGYQARPKIHVIRVVFQNQALYTRTSLRDTKTCKIGKKGCVFGHIDKFWKEHDRQIKNACKNVYLGSIFIPEKYVIRVLFVSPWTSLINPLAIWVAPPGSGIKWILPGRSGRGKFNQDIL